MQMTSSGVVDASDILRLQQKSKLHGKIDLLVFDERRENGSLTTECKR